jgi:hypothetical protein
VTKPNATMEKSIEILDSNDEKDKEKINAT